MEQNTQAEFQIEQLQKVIQNIDAQLKEVGHTLNAIAEFNKLKGTEEVLIPLANGIFAPAKLLETKNLKINIGQDIMIDKSVDECIKMMEGQAQEIQRYKDEIIIELDKITSQ